MQNGSAAPHSDYKNSQVQKRSIKQHIHYFSVRVYWLYGSNNGKPVFETFDALKTNTSLTLPETPTKRLKTFLNHLKINWFDFVTYFVYSNKMS